MKLVKLECPNCNAKLEGSSDLKQFTCNYCGTTTVLDDEKVTVNSVSSKLKNSIEDLKDYYENGNYDAAIELACSLIDEYPNNKEIQEYHIKSVLNNIADTSDSLQAFIDSQSLYYDYSDNKEVQNIYKEKAIKLYNDFIKFDDISVKLYYFDKIIYLHELLDLFPKDTELKQLHEKLKDNIIEFFNSNMENETFRNNLHCPNATEFKELINQVYPGDKKMEELCNKYSETYKEKELVEDSSDYENNSLEDDNKKENFILSLIFVDVPAILLLPFIMLTAHYEFSSPYLIISIVIGVFLIIGLIFKSNSCKVCGKFNGYQTINEEVLDSWVTTEERNEYNSSTNTSRKVYVTVTKENVRLTKKCIHCGDIRYEVTTRTKY